MEKSKKTIPDIINIEEEENDENTIIEGGIKCEQCEEKWMTINQLKQHMNLIHRPECNKCKLKLVNNNALKNHMEEAHTTKKRKVVKFTSGHCDNMYNSQEEALNHIKSLKNVQNFK